MRLLLALLALGTMSLPAQAALTLCNRTSYILYAATSAVQGSRSETEGWTRVAPGEWEAICSRMRDSYARKQWREGSLAGIAATHALLLKHFPGNDRADLDELPDRPVFL